jgi:hypothetical protein
MRMGGLETSQSCQSLGTSAKLPRPQRSEENREALLRAIATTLPLGSVGYENRTNAKGERFVWLEPGVVSKLRALRGEGESYSDVILRLAAESSAS